MVIYLGAITRELHCLKLDILWVITEIFLELLKVNGNDSLKVFQSKITKTMTKTQESQLCCCVGDPRTISRGKPWPFTQIFPKVTSALISLYFPSCKE